MTKMWPPRRSRMPGRTAFTVATALAGTARHAFTTAMSGSFLAGAAGVAAAAILALVLLRGRTTAAAE
ncbi:hypothetical protein [Nocardia sp. NPDC046763]|uniref:hypothetical protein n=1 Tax=Nocardia sp. NPDC046763 TaxID=3155256 RepID=UPI00340EAA0A